MTCRLPDALNVGPQYYELDGHRFRYFVYFDYHVCMGCGMVASVHEGDARYTNMSERLIARADQRAEANAADQLNRYLGWSLAALLRANGLIS